MLSLYVFVRFDPANTKIQWRIRVLVVFMCFIGVMCVYVCVCLCPIESNGPWRQASVHQQTAGISALPEYRWTTGAWQQAPPCSLRTRWVYGWLCVCARACVIDTKRFDPAIYIRTESERERDVYVCFRDWYVCVWTLTSGYVSQLSLRVYMCVCQNEGSPGCHRSHTHQAST